MSKEKKMLGEIGENDIGVFLPTNYVNAYNAMAEKFEAIEKAVYNSNDQEVVLKTLQEQLAKSFYALNFGYNVKQESKLNNKIEIEANGDVKQLINKEATVKPKRQGKLKGTGLSAIAANATGVSAKQTKWHLYNSGFWITIKPMSSDDKIALEARLVNELVEVGINTLGLIFSNDAAAYRSILLDFLRPFIDMSNSSLKFEEGDDPYDYISALDTDILIAALVYNIYPTGFPITLICRNNLEIEVNGVKSRAKCDNVLEDTVNALECVYADMDSLTEEQINILAMGRASVYKGTEEEYQNDNEIGLSILDYKNDMVNVRELSYTNGKFNTAMDIKLTIGDTTVNDLLKSADKFIIDLKTKIDDIILELSDKTEKQAVIEQFMDNVLLGKYIHFIKRLEIGGNWSDDMYDIYDALNTLRENDELAADIITKISEFIDDTLNYAIGHPRFECSQCKKVMNEDKVLPNKNLESIIPFNILYVFTILRIMP